MSKMIITNLTQVRMDFDKYKKSVERKNRGSLLKYGNLIMNKARSILRANVKRWTGKLAGSIKLYFQDKNSIIIEPNVPYDKWIEEGGRGGFKGYKYMSRATKHYNSQFLNEIKNNIRK